MSHIRISQWNILADGLAQNGNFKYCEPETLDWKQRHLNIISKINQSNSDVITLQEVNRLTDISNEYNSFMSTKESSPAIKYGYPADGIAILWKSHFKSIKQGIIKFTDNNDSLYSQEAIYVILQKSNIKFIVCSTHLKAKADYTDIRERQAKQLMNALDKLSNEYDCPVIIGCDMNDIPKSKPYLAIIEHTLKLKSVYENSRFTTWKFRNDEVKRVIDYIFISDKIKINKVEELPDEVAIGSEGLPNKNYPSDHLMLTADIYML